MSPRLTPQRPRGRRPLRSGLIGLALAAACATGSGCGPSQPGRDASDEAKNQLAAVSINEEQFPLAVLRLLRQGEPTAQRSALLAGVLRHQISRAAAHFDRGDSDRGTASVIGALYLLRAGEGRPDMFGPDGSRALAGAIAKYSARGDEGRSLALMLMRSSLLTGSSRERRELDSHVAALRRWMADTRTGGDMERLAATMRAAVDRALIDPREAALTKAAKAVSAWIERAVEYNLEFHRSGKPPPPPEAQEAFRALQTGGATMLAIFLRHGRAQGAVDHIESTAAHRVIPPPLFRLIETTADDDTATDWRAMAQVLARDAFEDEQLLRLDPAVRDAALWGAAVEAYRRDRGSLAIAHILADMLGDLGMPEVAPLVLADALGERPSPVSLSGALAALGEALEPELNAASTAAARQIFRTGKALLAIADRDEYRGRLDPSPTDLRELMARIEIRAGEVDAARPLMLATLEAEPSVWGYTRLAMLERQAGKGDSALAHARRALELPAAKVRVPGTGHRLDAVDAQLVVFELSRDGKRRDQALSALEQALAISLTTLEERLPPRARVRAELLLARILDGYGARSQAARALHRALEEATRHRPLLGPAMLGVIGRALVVGDLAAARAALQQGIDADAEQDDLVYGALWLMLLEAQAGEATDGKVERVLSQPWDEATWTGKLARWARGRMDDAALRKAASSYAQKVEAEFYIAMRKRTAQDGQVQQLRRVASNPLIDLMEVQLARDLLAPKFQAEVPKRYPLP